MMENKKAISVLKHMKNLITVRTFEEEALEKAIQALEKMQEFEAIGTVEEFKDLKEKSVPKKPIRKPNHNWTDEEVICPTCGSYILGNNHHCKCGQALEN